MKISEVSEKYNIPADTLRYYEKFGLIDNVSKISGVRNYSEEDCSRIEFIICMKHAGLSLEDIKTFINLNKEGDKTIPARLKILEHQKKILEDEIKNKEKTLDYLNYKINLYKGMIIMKSKVYFIKDITPENIIKAYEALGKKLEGKVAVKMHSGEHGNQNYLRPEFVQDVIRHVGGTVVECNTAYEGARNTTEKHRELIKEHEWEKYFPFDLMDADGPDLELDIPNGKILKKNYVGKNLANYDSMMVLSHFKGHAMGGYGGALKQLSIGCASSAGKTLIHTAGVTDNQYELFNNLPE